MSPCRTAPPRPKLPAATLLACALLAACGRIGVELLPESVTNGDDSVTEREAGADAGVDAAVVAAPDACQASCNNAHGSARCSDGQCLLTCSAGFADCDRDVRTGCETNLASDPVHCGACTRACDINTQLCQNGSCEASPCPPGRGECDADPTLACETDLTRSAESCGFCGNTCVAEHGSAACHERSCVIVGCDPGYADCDANLRTGCETSLNSVSDCGMCGRSCPAGGGSAVCSAGVCAVSCTLTGVFALKLSIPTTWPGTLLVSAGSGDFTFWGQLELAQSGTSLTGTFTPCGELVPDFRAAPLINERYGLTLPNAPFDRTPALPGLPARGALSDLAPGARFALERSAFLVGASLRDPIDGAWPDASALPAFDSDADGRLALSAPYKSGAGYTLPPANNLGTVRAQISYLTTRVVFSLDGVLSSCTQSAGSVLAQDIDSHTLGCRVLGDQRDCSATEAAHLDQNTPNFAPGAGTYQLVKLANAGCTAVRAALP